MPTTFYFDDGSFTTSAALMLIVQIILVREAKSFNKFWRAQNCNF
jgi:hypothetical protein